MKKFLLLIMLFCLSGCNKNNVEEIKKVKDVVPVKEEPKEEYVDLNDIKVGLYTKSSGKYTLWDEYYGDFKVGVDINTFQIVPSNEKELRYSGYYQDFIKEKWDSITSNYKLGIMLEYTLKDGKNIRHIIYDPSNTLENINYIQVYLYDAIKHKNDKWYSHIEESEFNENSYITSFKLTGGAWVSEITFPIKLSVFTYDGEDDFSEEGNYRGNSIYTINLYNKN